MRIVSEFLKWLNDQLEKGKEKGYEQDGTGANDNPPRT